MRALAYVKIILYLCREFVKHINMSAVVLQGLLDYLKSTLTMDNRKWLATHLVEPSAEMPPYTKEELIARAEDAEADIAAGRFISEEEMEAFMDGALQELKEREAA